MLPVSFPEQNFTFTKPSTMTDEQCSDLPVFKGKDSEGFPVIVSKWQLNKEELEEIARTGSIYLLIVGEGMPPVSPMVETPFTQP